MAEARRDIGPDEFMPLVAAERGGSGRHDLMLYVHIPFCSSKCHFCDFVADLAVPDVISGAAVRAGYVSALCAQIAAYAPRLAEIGYRPRLIYWGGGTPSRLAADELAMVITALTNAFDVDDVLEHSVESSPETLTEEKVRVLRRGGVDRISIGVQSFVEEELRRAGRAHSADEAAEAARAVRRGGIDNLNIDLIAGFPGQTQADTHHSLERCISLDPTHVTVYAYRADRRTVMARQIGRGDRPALELNHLVDAVELSRSALSAAGYTEYALGYFARDGHRFRGESYYFDLGAPAGVLPPGDFVGFGSGAGSSLGHHALANSYATFRRYRDDPLTMESCERYSPENLNLIGRTLRLALLNWSGVDYDRFEALYGFPFAALREQSMFQGYLRYFNLLGAEIIEDAHGIRLSETSKLRAHLRSYILSAEYINEPQSSGVTA
jgi:oxygen-independent coproporphyrinogen-3 oxidase